MSMVTYITQVVVELPHDTDSKEQEYSIDKLKSYINDTKVRLNRIASLVEFLQQQGFNLLRRNRKIVAYADNVEAFDIKRMLLDKGFSNHEFSIHLDYTRKWGVL